MKTVNVDSKKLSEIIATEVDRAGSTSWDIYVNEDGVIDCRHNTHDNEEWIEIYDLYSGWSADELQIDDVAGMAEWLTTVIDLDELSATENDMRDDDSQIELEWA